MITRLKRFLRRHFWLRLLTVAPHRLLICAQDALSGRVAEPPKDVDASTYAQRILSQYKLFGEVDRFHGRIAEVGPGKALGVAELLVHEGCEEVHEVDRFFSSHNGDPRIQRHVSEAEKFFHTHSGYDFILSAAVLEHLYDPLAAIHEMAAALKPAGKMVHIVDLRDHETFAPLHDLSFLRLPDWLYWPLRIRGGPNRVRSSDYQRCLAALPLQTNFYVIHLAGIKEDFLDRPTALAGLPESALATSRNHVREIRHRLAAHFRALTEEDLMITGIVFTATRL